MSRLSFKHCYKKLFHYNFVCTDHKYRDSFHTVCFEKDNIRVMASSFNNTVHSIACVIDGVDVAYTSGDNSIYQGYMFSGFKFEHFLDAVCAGKNTEVMEAFRKRDVLNTLNILKG